jgi:hypothetical protein
MKSTTALPRRSRRKAAKDAPSITCAIAKKAGKAALTPAIALITFADVHAANAAAVAATNSCRNPTVPFAPAAHAAVPGPCTCSTLPASLAIVFAANIMPIAALAPTANFATAEAAAADLSPSQLRQHIPHQV